MAAKSNYSMLNCTANTTALDPENEKICGDEYNFSIPTSAGSSEFSSAYVSPNDSECTPYWQLDLEKINLEKPRSVFDSVDISNISVSRPPSDPWDECDSVKTNNGELGIHSHVPNNSPCPNSFSTFFSDFTYSMLSNGFDENTAWENFPYHLPPPPPQMATDFNTILTTTDVTSFEPQIISTPNASRECDYQEFYGHQNASEPVPQNYYSFDGVAFSPPAFIPVTNNVRRPKPIKIKPTKKSLADHCVFCKNNGADPVVYNSHKVMDSKGRCLCPMLRQYQCPICKADGDDAHTTKYCPKRKIFTESEMNKMKTRTKCKNSLKF